MIENESGDIVAIDNSNEVVKVEELKTETETTESQEQEEQPEGEVKRKRPSGFHRKINKLEQQLAERDARLADLEQKLKPQSSDKPNIENFDSFDQYNEALTDWKVEQKLEERDQKKLQEEETKKAKEQESSVLSAWEQKEESLGDKYEEYEELVAQHQNTKFRQELIQATFESDLGPQIRHYLLKNPDELAKINKSPAELSSYAIFKKVAELESKLSIPPVNKVSKSSEPITPVRGSAKTSISLDKISDTDQWIATRHPHLYGKK